MARVRPPFAGALGDFDIFHPGIEESVPLNANGTITVTVDDNGEHDSFHARVFDVCDLDAPHFSTCSMPYCVPLTPPLVGNTWTGQVPVGYLDPFDILEHSKQIVVYGSIDGVGTAEQHQKFRITRGGSAALPCGSLSGSGSGSGSQGSCRFCADLTPVPVCLRLTYDHTIQNGSSCGDCDELNDDFVLQHSNDRCVTCCWFSGPVDFCNGVSMGYWKLEKIDARQWQAGVYYSESGHVSFPVVLYNFTTGTDNDCVISILQPLVLTLDANSVGDECSNWPSTIRFTPA